MFLREDLDRSPGSCQDDGMRGSRTALTIIATSGALFTGVVLHQARPEPSVPVLAMPGECRYDVILSGPNHSVPSSLGGVALGSHDHSRPSGTGRHPSMQATYGSGETSHFPPKIWETSDDLSHVLSTVSTGDRNGNAVITGILSTNPDIGTPPSPSFILRPRPGSNCGDDVMVYAQDASAISKSSLEHVEACNHIPEGSCGPPLPISMLATCRLRSSFPKGKALYLIGKRPHQIAFLADWTAMSESRFGRDGYKPANTRKSCPNPF